MAMSPFSISKVTNDRKVAFCYRPGKVMSKNLVLPGFNGQFKKIQMAASRSHCPYLLNRASILTFLYGAAVELDSHR
jgi:hypothetical protein